MIIFISFLRFTREKQKNGRKSTGGSGVVCNILLNKRNFCLLFIHTMPFVARFSHTLKHSKNFLWYFLFESTFWLISIKSHINRTKLNYQSTIESFQSLNIEYHKRKNNFEIKCIYFWVFALSSTFCLRNLNQMPTNFDFCFM